MRSSSAASNTAALRERSASVLLSFEPGQGAPPDPSHGGLNLGFPQND
jgi:hypothetical protein